MRASSIVTPLFVVVASIAAFAACTDNGGGSGPSTQATCGPQPTLPNPQLQLSYPIPGSTAVPDNVGQFVVQGLLGGPYGNATVSLAPSPGPSVPVGLPTLDPSPQPSPLASSLGSGYNYYAIPVPALSPATNYTAQISYTAYQNTPPTCTTPIIEQIGSFTTQ